MTAAEAKLTTWRLRHCATLTPRASKPISDDAVVSFLPMEAIGEDGSLDLTGEVVASEAKTGYTFFENDDVVIAKITPCFENGKGALIQGLRTGAGYGTTELHVLRCKSNLDPRFLSWITASPEFRDKGTATMLGAGGQKRVTPEFVLDYRFDLPTLSVQRQIADYLDRETAKIDKLIKEKEDLLKLLDERRQALITEAVTRGLDPTVPMKDSGLLWLGPIPASWEMTPLMFLVDQQRPIMYGIVLPGPSVDVGVPIVKGGDVRPDRLKLDRLSKTTFEIEAGYERSRLKAGDIVYAIRGSVGDAEIVPKEIEGANLTQDAARIAPRVGINVQWLLYAIRSDVGLKQARRDTLGATIPGLNIRELKRLLIPTPPPEEQLELANQLQKLDNSHKEEMRNLQQSSTALRTRRASLIHEAVTGMEPTT